MQRAKENDVSMAGTPNNIHVVDYAAEPTVSVGPRRIQSILIALALSLAFGVGLAVFLEYLDDTVKSPEDVERGLRLPCSQLFLSLAERLRSASCRDSKGRKAQMETAADAALN